MPIRKIIGIGETVLDIIFRDDQPSGAIPGGSTFNAMVSLGIGREQIPAADWKGVISIAGQFSAEVCASMFNYVGKEFRVRL